MRFLIISLISAGLLLSGTPLSAQFVLQSSSPQRNQRAVTLNESIRLTFNQPVNSSTVSGSISVVSHLKGNLTGTTSVAGNEVTFDPSLEFIVGDEITVTLRSTMMSQSAEALSNPSTLRFQTHIGASPANPPTFKDPEIYRSSDGIAPAIDAVDFDRDGDIDAVDGVRWLENLGDGSYQSHLIVVNVVVNQPEAIKVVDIDMDNDLDIVIGGSYHGVRLLINDSQFNFTSLLLTDIPINCVSIDVADFDSNGLPDILYSRDQIATSILYNQGANQFSASVVSPTRADKVKIVDMDKDGDLDIIQQDFQQVRYLENTGAAFQSSEIVAGNIHDTAVDDFDNDGDIDLVIAMDDHLWLFDNDGPMVFTPIVIGETINRFSSGDFDGDGDVDLILPGYDIMRMGINQGDHTFLLIPMGSKVDGFSVSFGLVSTADFDGDGDLDAMIGYNQVIVKMYENSPLYSVYPFTEMPDVSSLKQGSSSWGDYDNDGDLDLLATGYSDGAITLLYRNDEGVLIEVPTSLPGVFNGASEWGDYDNDGDLDILLVGSMQTGSGNYTSTSRIYTNQSGQFELLSSSLTQLPQVTDAKAAWADINDDGWKDIVIAAAFDSGIYQSDGLGNFTKVFAFPAMFSSSRLDVGDYDGDGDADLALSAWSGSDFGLGVFLKVYRNESQWDYQNAQWDFTDVTGQFIGRIGGNISWADVDNDGDLDLVVSGNIRWSDGFQFASFSVYENNHGTFVGRANQPMWGIDSYGSTTTGDIDNDGDTDVLGSTRGDTGEDPDLVFMINDGTGLLTTFGGVLPDLFSSSISLGDYDGDGDLDAYTGKLLRSNLPGQNARPLPPGSVTADSVYNNSIYFHWTNGMDPETTVAGLSYDVMVGTASHAQDVVQPGASFPDGSRVVARSGSIKGTRGRVTRLQGGDYYLAVQTVDASFAGSSFSPEALVHVIGIHGNIGACIDDEDTYVAQPAGPYTWQAVGGTIVEGQGTGAILVRWNAAGKGFVKVSNGLSDKNVLEVFVDEPPDPVIFGLVQVCTGLATFHVEDIKSIYSEWSVTGGNFVAEQSAHLAKIDWMSPGAQMVIVQTQPLHLGCTSYDTLNVDVDLRPDPQIAGATQVCTGETAKYTTQSTDVNWSTTFGSIVVDSSAYVRVKWSTASDTASISIAATSKHAYCSTTKKVTVRVELTPPKPTIILQDGILWSSPSPSGIYRWFRNGHLIGEGPYIGLETQVAGFYAVAVSNLGCSAISDEFPHLITAVEPTATGSPTLIVYPNPATQEITLELNSEEMGEHRVLVNSMIQSTLMDFTLVKSGQKLSHSIDISSFHSGMYVITVTRGSTLLFTRFIKH